MATLADELQNDFADSGSENEGQYEEGSDGDTAPQTGRRRSDEEQDGVMEEDGDEGAAHPEALPGEAPEETEARLKAQKRANEEPADMRKVSRFSAKMDPVLKVSHLLMSPARDRSAFTSLNVDLTNWLRL